MRSRDHLSLVLLGVVVVVVVSFAAVPSADAFALPVGGGRASARTASTSSSTTTTTAVRATDDDETAFGGPGSWLSGMALAAALWAAPASTMTMSPATVAFPGGLGDQWTSSSSRYVASAKEMASGSGTRVNKDPESLLRYGLPIDNSEVRNPGFPVFFRPQSFEIISVYRRGRTVITDDRGFGE